MPKYLLQVSYTPEGAKGLKKDGGTKRRQAAQKLIESVGGKMEAFYFAFGEHDAFVIADMPDAASMAAASIATASTGATSGKTTVLITPEEMDHATKKSTTYSPPGH
jgi:uncharacterized protein with GYD domain